VISVLKSGSGELVIRFLDKILNRWEKLHQAGRNI
jgi:hypothetical protein